MQRFFENTDVSLTVFRIDAENFIEVAGKKNENFEENLFKGIEFAVDSRPIDGFRVQLACEFLEAKDKSDGTQRDELQYRPKRKYSLATTYRFPFGLTLYGDILRVVDQYFYDETQTFQNSIDDYTLVNFKLAQRFLKDMFEVYVGLDNLLDEDYEQSYGLTQAGRTFYGGVTYSF
jgi:vitamin B12 transporter